MRWGLMRFKGDLRKWPAFWSIFEKEVHNNEELSNTDKLIQLLGVLKGPAARAVEDINLTDANYDVALGILRQRYQRPAKLKSALWAQLVAFPPCKDGKTKYIRDHNDAMERVLRQLEASGEDFAHHAHLIPCLLATFPSKFVEALHLAKPRSDEWDFKNLREAISVVLDDRDNLEAIRDLHRDRHAGQPTKTTTRRDRYDDRRSKGGGSGGGGSPNYFSPRGGSGGSYAGRQGYRSQSKPDHGSSHKYKSSEATSWTPNKGSGTGGYGHQSGHSHQNRSPSSSFKYTCFLCGRSDHSASRCTQFGSHEARVKRFLQQSRCLKCGQTHHRGESCKASYDYCKKCGRRGHHISLCHELLFGPNRQMTLTEEELKPKTPPTQGPQTWSPHPKKKLTFSDEGSSKVTTTSAMYANQEPVEKETPGFMMFARVSVAGNKGIVDTYALIDSGCNETWLEMSLADQIGCEMGKETTTTLTVFGSVLEKKVCPGSCQLQTNDGSNMQLEVRCSKFGPMQEMTIPAVPVKAAAEVKALVAPRNMAMELPKEDTKLSVGLIIGIDYLFSILKPDRLPLPSGYYLQLSKLGAIFAGKHGNPNSMTTPTSVTVPTEHAKPTMATSLMAVEVVKVASDGSVVKEKEPTDINPNLEEFFSLEAVGITDNIDDDDDETAITLLKESIEKTDNGRFSVKYPWKKGIKPEEVPDNYGLAHGRFNSLERKFRQNPTLKDKYATNIKDLLNRGTIEKVTEPTKATGPRISYTPHQAVETPQKATTKVRIVFDHSAKEGKHAKSLNDCLLKGPSLLPNIVGLLVVLGLFHTLILCDIEKAFHTIGIHESNRDAFRFIWYDDADNAPVGGKRAIYRFCRVVFGAISSPFLLAGTLRYELGAIGSKLAKLMLRMGYVDNFLLQATGLEECKQVYNESKAMLAAVNMNLREFISNDTAFNEWIPSKDKADGPVVKVLGLVWDTRSDRMSIGPPKLVTTTTTLTKRLVVRMVATVFDPLGIASPVLTTCKVFIQKLWEQQPQPGWDEELPPQLQSQWQPLQHQLSLLPQVTWKRFFLSFDYRCKWNLITYADASQFCYAACSYLKATFPDGTSKMTLVMSKVRLRPKGETRIPRLELLAANAGANMMRFLKKELSDFITIEACYLCLDSKCVIYWICSDGLLPTFVKNRCFNIRKLKAFLVYVVSALNPADVASRGCTVAQLLAHSLWWEGPKWAKLPPTEWPNPPIDMVLDDPRLLLEPNTATTTTTTTTTVMAAETVQPEPVVTRPAPLAGVEVERFSKLEKLQRTLVLVYRFLLCQVWTKTSPATKATKPRLQALFSVFQTKGPITTAEIGVAMNRLIRNEQQRAFPHLSAGLPPQRLPVEQRVLQRSLNVKKGNDGLLRCYGRLANTDLPVSTKFPALLSKGATHFNCLVVLFYHRKAHHQGVTLTLSLLRTAFWLLRGRQVVKTIVAGKKAMCRTCRLWSAPPYHYPTMPDLPAVRLQANERAFRSVGVDGLAQFIVKDHNGERIKIFSYVYVCCTFRAIHIELAPSLSAESFIDTFRRFISRRTRPDWVISDGQKGLKLAAQVLSNTFQAAILSEVTTDFCGQNAIQWSFSVPLASFQMGLVERLVGIIKAAIRRAIGTRLLTLWELLTILAEIEALINARPLCTEPDTEPEIKAIRPADFLTQGPTGLPDLTQMPPPIPAAARTPTAEGLVAALRKKMRILKTFHTQFYTLYLPYLRQKQRKEFPNPMQTAEEGPTVNSVVLVEEMSPKRDQWNLGRIVSLVTSEDGKVRSAMVQIKGQRPVQRTINNLYPLEVGSGPVRPNPQAETQPTVPDEVGEADNSVDDEDADEAKDAETSSDDDLQAEAAADEPPERQQRVNQRYGLRPKPKRRQLMMAVSTLLCLLPLTHGLRCGKHGKGELRSVGESHRCRRRGVSVYEETSSGFLCHKVLTCRKGSYLDGKGKCRKGICKCPTWASHCTNPDIPSIKPKDMDEQLTALNPSVCSFRPSPRCSSEWKQTSLHKVRLYNGSNFFVKSLNVVLEEPAREDSTCYGEGAEMAGPNRFCQSRNCVSKARKYCYYKHNEIAFLLTPQGRLPILAWGHQNVRVYLPKKRRFLSGGETDCAQCTFQCVQGGVNLSLTEEISAAEICVKTYCRMAKFPSTQETILLPSKYVLQDHTITVHLWSGGKLVKTDILDCIAKPFCEQIQCRMCWSLLTNLHCVSAIEMLVVAMLAYFSALAAYYGFRVLKLAYRALATCSKTIRQLIQWLRRWCCCRTPSPRPPLLIEIAGAEAERRRRERLLRREARRIRRALRETRTQPHSPDQSLELTDVDLPSTSHSGRVADANLNQTTSQEERKRKAESEYYRYDPKTKKYVSIMMLITCLTVMVGQGLCDSEFTSMTVKSDSCAQVQNKSMKQMPYLCEVTEKTRLTLAPHGQKSRLLVKQQKGEIMGALELTIDRIHLRCVKKSEYFTRSHEFLSSSVRRCANAGTCSNNKCEAIDLSTKIGELKGEANDHPGYSYCASVSGGWFEGCFFATYSCLFYRTYAKATTETIYEVFSCPTWTTEITIKAKLIRQDDQAETTLSLSSGQSQKWLEENLTLTLLSKSTPAVPLLSTQFLTDGEKVAVVAAAAAGQPITGRVGEIQCTSRKKAKDFQCALPKNPCTCVPQQKVARCDCPSMSMEDAIQDSTKLLPLTTVGVDLKPDKGSVVAAYNLDTVLEVEIQMKGSKFAAKIDKAMCRMSAKIDGCYSCLAGAKLNYKCHTDNGDALGLASCGLNRFPVPCSASGTQGTVSLSFTQSEVDQECDVTCPAGTTKFSVKGQLEYTGEKMLGKVTSTHDKVYIAAQSVWSRVKAAFTSNWWKAIIAAATALGLAIITIILIPYIIQLVGLTITNSANCAQRIKKRAHQGNEHNE